MKMSRRKKSIKRKTYSGDIFSPKFPNAMPWDCNQASVVKSK
jgi:hypothetical protein